MIEMRVQSILIPGIRSPLVVQLPALSFYAEVPKEEADFVNLPSRHLNFESNEN